MVNHTPFNSILIANRGEIACRVMRTATSMGIRTIAVYSDADANAPHVKMADDAVHIGASPVGESYLVIDKIIDAAKKSGAEAIHPGYGFLSENAAFAQACDDAGIIFVGPPIDAIDVMGDKAKSKIRMIAAGVPCIPGYQGTNQETDFLAAEADKIGYPVMVKASAGGGGRGMRIVYDQAEIKNAIDMARAEGQSAFGSGELIMERAVINPRHVEIQVFADKHGNVVHLGERDCSVQRRHQKVLEESPCPVMTPELRNKMGMSAVKAAQDVHYVGAGTVEFLLDDQGDYFFLEMNTRLQVEHPVTEIVTGLDLVALQFRAAMGEPLGVAQEDVTLTGHAIEARLYAEDPYNDFLPATGNVDLYAPSIFEGIRVDDGIETGGEISPFYDPMVAKIIGYGASRDEARRRLIKSLSETAVFGFTTNKHFLINALRNHAFAKGDATTAFISNEFDDAALTAPNASHDEMIIAAILQCQKAERHAQMQALTVPQELQNWTSSLALPTPFTYIDPTDDEAKICVYVTPQSNTQYTAQIDDQSFNVEIIKKTDHQLMIRLDDTRHDVLFFSAETANGDSEISLSTARGDFTLINQDARMNASNEAIGKGTIIAPMHGALLAVMVSKGEHVVKGQRLAILEAMKMQHEIEADIDGVIKDIFVTAGTQIEADSLMIEIEASEDL